MELNNYDFTELGLIVKILERDGYIQTSATLKMIIRKLKRDK